MGPACPSPPPPSLPPSPSPGPGEGPERRRTASLGQSRPAPDRPAEAAERPTAAARPADSHGASRKSRAPAHGEPGKTSARPQPAGELPHSGGRPAADARPASRPRRDPCPPRALPPRSERMRFADPLSPARRPSHAGKRPGCDFAPPPSPAQTRPQSFRSPPPFPRRLPRSPRFIMRTADKSGCVCCGSAVSSRQAAALTRSRASAATQSHGQRFGPKICIYRHPTGCSVCRYIHR